MGYRENRNLMHDVVVKLAFAVLVLVSAAVEISCQQSFNPDAGLVRSLTRGKNITVTSNPSRAFAVLDGNASTHWQADGCFPDAYWSRQDLTSSFNLCSTNSTSCSATPAAGSDLAKATDGDSNTAVGIKANSTSFGYLNITLPSAASLVRRLGIKISTAANSLVNVTIVNDGVPLLIGSLTNSSNYLKNNYIGPWENVSRIIVTGNASFSVFEVAALKTNCTEYATVDLGAVTDVSVIRTRHWAGGSATKTELLTSTDAKSWVLQKVLDPVVLSTVDTYFSTPLQVRYIRVLHYTTEGDWNKVYIWTIDSYGEYGPWGPPPVAVEHTKPFRSILGINGIWGWGVKDNTAAGNYSEIATIARNYHSMNWDVSYPFMDPKYDTMNTTGTGTMWWLDWDAVYGTWMKYGMKVIATYQFTTKVQPPTAAVWSTNVYNATYALGYKFARHFGPTYGTNKVHFFEVGNEPWDYNATFYAEVLRGFVDGLSDGDPNLPVAPCALQADDDMVENYNSGSYIGARVSNQTIASKLKWLNMHAYSYYTTNDGKRRGVHPEHPGSTMNSVNNMLRWRDVNTPDVPVKLTEWGWDAPREHMGEVCTFPECVPMNASSVYAVRGLLVLARKGIDSAIWFFYANDVCDTRFCRSGVRDIVTMGGAPLGPYFSLRGFLQVAGLTRFHSIVREDPDAYVYLLSNSLGVVTHVAAWRPIDAADNSTIPITFSDASLSDPPLGAWMIADKGAVPATLPTVSASDPKEWRMEISAIPTIVSMVVVVSPSPPPPAPPSPPPPAPKLSPSPPPGMCYVPCNTTLTG